MAGHAAEYVRLHKAVVVDMSYVFKDAVLVKQEAGEESPEEGGQNREVQAGGGTFWVELALKIDYLKTERGQMQLYREGFIQVIRTAVSQIPVKKWAKSSITSFVKEIFFNKEGFFTKDQISELEDIMAKMNNETVSSASTLKLNSGNQMMTNIRDDKILSTPLNSYNQVKDNREWSLAEDGLEKWSSRQFGR